MELDHICLIRKASISLVLSSMDSKEIEDTIPTLEEFVVQQGGSETAAHTTVQLLAELY